LLTSSPVAATNPVAIHSIFGWRKRAIARISQSQGARKRRTMAARASLREDRVRFKAK